MKNFIEWLKNLKPIYRTLFVLALSVCILLSTLSCGSTTRAVVRNLNGSAISSVTISTNNPSQIEINPAIKVDSITTKKNAK